VTVPRWLPPLFWAGVILLATSVPTDLVPKQLSAFDKAVHFGMYFVLAVLLTRYVLAGRVVLRAAIVSVVSATVFGAADEWHQRFIPGRSTEFADWVADTAGALAGVAVVVAFSMRKPVPRKVQ
jgi:VanZ family protein